LLGFRQPSDFVAAFQSWSQGVSPAAFRAS
jgi:AraC-like DNA-binding protein